jgi:hypothetical protein
MPQPDSCSAANRSYVTPPQLIQDFLKTAAASEMHPVYRSKLLACRRKGTVRTALGRGPFPAPGLDSSAGRSY